MPFSASSGVTSTSLSAKSGKPAAVMHALTTAIVRLPSDGDIPLVLLSGNLTFQSGDPCLVFHDGLEGTPHAGLPASQTRSFAVETCAQPLNRTLPLLVGRWRYGRGSNDPATWRSHLMLLR